MVSRGIGTKARVQKHQEIPDVKYRRLNVEDKPSG